MYNFFEALSELDKIYDEKKVCPDCGKEICECGSKELEVDEMLSKNPDTSEEEIKKVLSDASKSDDDKSKILAEEDNSISTEDAKDIMTKAIANWDDNKNLEEDTDAEEAAIEEVTFSEVEIKDIINNIVEEIKKAIKSEDKDNEKIDEVVLDKLAEIFPEEDEEESEEDEGEELTEAVKDENYVNMMKDELDKLGYDEIDKQIFQKNFDGIYGYISSEDKDGKDVDKFIPAVALDAYDDLYAESNADIDDMSDRYKKTLEQVKADFEKAKANIEDKIKK